MTSWPLKALSVWAYIRAFEKFVAIDLSAANSVVGWGRQLGSASGGAG